MLKGIREYGSFQTEDVILKGCDMEISIPSATLNERMKQIVEEYIRTYESCYKEYGKAFFDLRIIFRKNHDLFGDNTIIRLYEWQVVDGEITNQSFDDFDVDFSEESLTEIKKLVQDRINIIFE